MTPKHYIKHRFLSSGRNDLLVCLYSTASPLLERSAWTPGCFNVCCVLWVCKDVSYLHFWNVFPISSTNFGSLILLFGLGFIRIGF